MNYQFQGGNGLIGIKGAECLPHSPSPNAYELTLFSYQIAVAVCISLFAIDNQPPLYTYFSLHS